MDELHYQVDLLTAMNQKLSVRESMYQMICSTSNNAFIFCNFADNHLEVLGNWNFYFDFEITEYKDISKILEMVEPDNIPAVKETLYYEKTGGTQSLAEAHLPDKRQWIECDVTVNYDEYAQPVEKVIRIRNITKFKSQYDELLYMAYYDALTGLYNRNNFIRILTEWIIQSNKQETISIIFADIDDFHKINDGLGMLVGDELVQNFGQFLRDFESDHVIISHFTSDLFCMAVRNPCGSRSVETIYKTIKERIGRPFVLADKTELLISVSFGVSEYPEAAENAVDLISYAEIAMFRSKAEGKRNLRYFNSDILTTFLRNVEIEHMLKEAVFFKSFYLDFQPQYEAKKKKLRGVEALIRWKDNAGNQIGPAEFIPVAEKNNLILPIGDWVIEESLRIFQQWKHKYRYPMVISINISAVQYKKDDFVPKLLAAMQKYEVNYHEVEVEITESILIDSFENVIEKMYQLRSYGVRVSLDDFGTGFSSLSYLNGLPIDTIKIDKAFVDTITENESTRIIVEAIITMVQKLGYEIIAEGVETEEQFLYLREISCDNIQGYLLGKPMSASRIEELLKKQI